MYCLIIGTLYIYILYICIGFCKLRSPFAHALMIKARFVCCDEAFWRYKQHLELFARVFGQLAKLAPRLPFWFSAIQLGGEKESAGGKERETGNFVSLQLQGRLSVDTFYSASPLARVSSSYTYIKSSKDRGSEWKKVWRLCHKCWGIVV